MKTMQILLPLLLLVSLAAGYGLFISLRAVFRRRREKEMAKAIEACKFEINSKSGSASGNIISLYEVYDGHIEQALLLDALAGCGKFIGDKLISFPHKEYIEKSLSGYAINQAACVNFAGRLPVGWSVKYRLNGGISGFFDENRDFIKAYSRDDSRALRSVIIKNPHNCIVDNDTYRLMEDEGTLAQLNQQGFSVYKGNYTHCADPTVHVDDSDIDVHSHIGDLLIAGRVGMSLVRNAAQVAKGEKSLHEGGKDVAVDVGVSVVRAKAEAVGFALGGPLGAALGRFTVTAMGEVLREEWKYGQIMALLERVGAEFQTSLDSPWARGRIIESVACGCLGYGPLRDELKTEQERCRQYEKETRFYSSSYSLPTTSGVLCRMRHHRLQQECNRVESAVDNVLTQIHKMGKNRRSSRGILGELVLASQDLFHPIISEKADVVGFYKKLTKESPNHPYRLFDEKNLKAVDSRDYFISACIGQYYASRQFREEQKTRMINNLIMAAAGFGFILFITYSQTFWTSLADWLGGSAPQASSIDASNRTEKSADQEENNRFLSMSPGQHLTSAQAALDEGYDRRRRIGGNLERAERHLLAIASSTPENKKAQRLLRVIADRRRRTAIRENGVSSERPNAGQLAHPPDETLPFLKRKRPPAQPGAKQGTGSESEDEADIF